MGLRARPIRLVITGVESTGKSTLASAIARHFNYPLALEAARYDEKIQSGTFDVKDLNRLTEAQFNAAKEAQQKAETTGSGGMISDTGGLVLEMWGEAVFGEIPEGSRDLQHWFDLHIICPPDIPWEADVLRSLPNREDRLALHNCYIQRLEDAEVNWVQTKGSAPLERFLFTVQAIQMALNRHINE
jgi:nicotinamide riboside kinase